MTPDKVELTAMPTPNPNTVKFLLNQKLFESGSLEFSSAEEAADVILAEQLFNISEVEGVMVGFNFISVTKSDQAQWDQLLEPVRDSIIHTLETEDEPIPQSRIDTSSQHSEQSDEISTRIKEILDNEIRPAIAMDGGDIVFRSFKDGIVSLFLMGACSNCPSSTMTLKMGIENRLKSEFPEIKEVVQEA